MGEKEKGKSSGEKIQRPESKPEPTKNILTEAKTRPDRQENFSNDKPIKGEIRVDIELED